jgi:hypothetical protein
MSPVEAQPDRTAVYGPVCTVVWEGRRREASPYPDLGSTASRVDRQLSEDFCRARPCRRGKSANSGHGRCADVRCPAVASTNPRKDPACLN